MQDTMPTPLAPPIRHDSEFGWSESVYRDPHPAIRTYVVGPYQGWTEYSSVPIRRREVPSAVLPLILNLGAPFRLLDSQGLETVHEVRKSFAAGLHTSYSLVESAGHSVAIQVNMTPIGAMLLFGMPLEWLTNRVVALDEIFGADGRRVLERLYDATCWAHRFDILDGFIAGRMQDARSPSPEVVRCWKRLCESDGTVTVHQLADELSYSRKHLTARFREEMGLPPKVVARILRFGDAVRALESGARPRLADLAQNCGYYDQAHFVRDFVAFAGVPPGELLRRRLPDGSVIDPPDARTHVPFVQDVAPVTR